MQKTPKENSNEVSPDYRLEDLIRDSNELDDILINPKYSCDEKCRMFRLVLARSEKKTSNGGPVESDGSEKKTSNGGPVGSDGSENKKSNGGPVGSDGSENKKSNGGPVESDGELMGNILCIFVGVCFLIHLLIFVSEVFQWHLSAIGRIIMIEMLPYFDWRYLKYEKCLISKNLDQSYNANGSVFDCNVCESLRDIDYFTVNRDPGNEETLQEFVQKYIEADRPVIVEGAIDHWLTESPKKFVEQLIDKKDFSLSLPCNLETNIHSSKRSDNVDLDTLFHKKKFFDSFFMHFQNCDVDAMKVFRNYTYRPAILPSELLPIKYNWFLWNKNYSSMNYKTIQLIEKYTVMGQVFGSTRFRLVARKNCHKMCPRLEGDLPAGHVLIFTHLWDLEYLPEGDDDNLAAILEIPF